MNVIASAVWGKSSPKECDMQDIKKLVQDHPYFAPAQFLLLQQLKEQGGEAYLAQAQKAVLYYHDPMEFEYFINAHRFETELLLEEPATGAPEGGAEVWEKEKRDVKENTEREIAALKEESGETHNPPEESQNIPPLVVMAPTHTTTSAIAAEKAVLPEEEQFPKQEESSLQPAGGPATNDVIAFEPYHTVDYFASQGIKLQQEEVPKDKFGKQLKSFTDWLKTMKRLPGQPALTPADASAEQNVQHMAEGSVHNPDVATEAMAEVWLKQGNSAKAIEVYEKLKLHNPAKSAYFAAKIENLKYS